MVMKTALVIGGDSTGAKKAVDELTAGVEKAGASANNAKAPLAGVDQSQQSVANSARTAAGAVAEEAAAMQDATTAAAALGGKFATIGTGMSAMGGAIDGATKKTNAHTQAVNDNQKELARHAAGARNLGQQFGDLAVMVQGGIDPIRAFTTQAGQMGYAMSEMGGKIGAVGTFLTSMGGVALTVAVTSLAPLVAELFKGSQAADEAKKSTLDLTDALDKHRFATDAGRAAIKAYNEQQDESRKKQRLITEETLKSADARIADAISTRMQTKELIANLAAREQATAGFVGTGGVSTNQINGPKLAAAQEDLRRQDAALEELRQARRNMTVQFAQRTSKEAADPIRRIEAFYEAQAQGASDAATKNDRLAASLKTTLDAIEKKKAADLEDERANQRRANAKPPTVSLGNQIEAGSAARILASAERYRGVSEHGAGRTQLTSLFGQAGIRMDPEKDAWCAAFVNAVLAGNGLKGTGSLAARSFLGYGEATDKPNKGDIVVSRRGNNAALGHVGFYQGTDAKGNVLVLGGNTGDRVGTQAIKQSNVLGFRRAPTAASSYADEAKAQADALKLFQQDLQQVTQAYLPATAEAKKYADELARIEKLAKAYNAKDAASGLSPEQAAAARAALKEAHDKRMADLAMTPEAKAADEAKKSIDGVIASLQEELSARQTLDPVQQAMVAHQAELAKMSDLEREAYEKKLTALYGQKEAYKAAEEATRAAAQAQAELRNMALDAFDAIAIGGEKAGDVIKRLAQSIASAAIQAAVMKTGPLAALLNGGIADAATKAGGGPVLSSASAGAGGVASAATQVVADATGKAVSKGVGDRLEGIFGKGKAGVALQNAGFGYTAASITGGSGVGGSLGGMVGGQIAGKLLASTLGSFAGPLGSIAGGILGGVVGKLFSGKPKEYGSSSISFSDGTASAAAAIGKGSAEREKASALGGSVADGLNAIAQQLGATLGSANVSIGYRPGHKAGAYRVDTTGAGRVTGVDAFESEAEAVAYAIRDAIADGVVQTSQRVQQALRSSTDVDKAVAEAVKVQELETLMGGVTSTIDKAFADFERTAKERMRLATTYGFDVVAIEKKNGEDRVKLVEQLTAQQVGSLQSLVKEMEAGSLFEGTGLDKLKAIDEAIAKAKADLAAGVDGAADTLANLSAKKLQTSKDVYGSTTGYAADRQAVYDDARKEIAAANKRIADAQSKGTSGSDPALATTNKSLDTANRTLDEMADQNAKLIRTLEEAQAAIVAAVIRSTPDATGSRFLDLAKY